MTISQDQGQDPQPRKRLGPADRARDDARLEAGPGSGNTGCFFFFGFSQGAVKQLF